MERGRAGDEKVRQFESGKLQKAHVNNINSRQLRVKKLT